MTLTDAAPSLRKPANTNATSTLKLIALFFMIIDHAGKVLMNNQYEWRLLGRIAFPIYAWCLVVGVCYTHSVPKYARRLFITGLVSQPLYVIALNHTWPMFTKPNIFLTLLLGLFALWGMRDKKYGSQFWAPAIALCLATVLHADYDWRGVLLIILLFAVRDSRPGIAAVMVAYFLFWGSFYSVPKTLFGIEVDLTALPAFLSDPLSHFLRLETFALLSLPFILIPFSKYTRKLHWFNYIAYPAHLVLLIIPKWTILGQAPVLQATFGGIFF